SRGRIVDAAPDIELVAKVIRGLALNKSCARIGEGDGGPVGADGAGGGPGAIWPIGREEGIPGGMADHDVGAITAVSGVVVVKVDVGEVSVGPWPRAAARIGISQIVGVANVNDVLAVMAEARHGQTVDVLAQE